MLTLHKGCIYAIKEKKQTKIFFLWTYSRWKTIYVGQTVNLKRRVYEHHINKSDQKIDKYLIKLRKRRGIQSYKYIILERIYSFRRKRHDHRLNKQERYYIHKFSTLWPNGYNMLLPKG